MFTLISLIAHYWWVGGAVLGLAGGFAWYRGLIVFGDLAGKALDLIRTRAGLAAIALIAGLVTGYVAKSNDTEAEKLQSKIVAMQRDVDIAAKAKESAESRLSEVAKNAFKNNARVLELETDLAHARDKPAPEPQVIVKQADPKIIIKKIRSCPMNDEEVRRLKEIR